MKRLLEEAHWTRDVDITDYVWVRIVGSMRKAIDWAVRIAEIVARVCLMCTNGTRAAPEHVPGCPLGAPRTCGWRDNTAALIAGGGSR